MAKYYILVKRKGSASWLGAIPAKKGVSLAKLRAAISRNLKKGFVYKIVTSAQIKRIIQRRGVSKRRTAKRPRRMRRRAVRRVRRRRRVKRKR